MMGMTTRLMRLLACMATAVTPYHWPEPLGLEAAHGPLQKCNQPNARAIIAHS